MIECIPHAEKKKAPPELALETQGRVKNTEQKSILIIGDSDLPHPYEQRERVLRLLDRLRNSFPSFYVDRSKGPITKTDIDRYDLFCCLLDIRLASKMRAGIIEFPSQQSVLLSNFAPDYISYFWYGYLNSVCPKETVALFESADSNFHDFTKTIPIKTTHNPILRSGIDLVLWIKENVALD
jgi:hypothetical protein